MLPASKELEMVRDIGPYLATGADVAALIKRGRGSGKRERMDEASANVCFGRRADVRLVAVPPEAIALTLA